MILLPGATGTPNGNQGSSNPGQEVAINGNLPYSNILADGASTTLSHSQNANPAIFETVSELQVNTSSFSAQYGIGGVIFNQVTKGGTSQFHGAAYDYFQNDALTAHTLRVRCQGTEPIPFLRYNNFGFAIGGPDSEEEDVLLLRLRPDRRPRQQSPASNSVPTTHAWPATLPACRISYDPTTQTIAIDSQGQSLPGPKELCQ